MSTNCFFIKKNLPLLSESDIHALVDRYKQSEMACRDDRNVSFSEVEICKLDIADWILDRIGARPLFPATSDRYQKTRIPNEVRWEVMERDNYTCRICGKRRDLTVDHVIAESKGGTACVSNLQTLCRPCNSRKGRS